jgi:hypothetical protein
MLHFMKEPQKLFNSPMEFFRTPTSKNYHKVIPSSSTLNRRILIKLDVITSSYVSSIYVKLGRRTPAPRLAIY